MHTRPVFQLNSRGTEGHQELRGKCCHNQGMIVGSTATICHSFLSKIVNVGMSPGIMRKSNCCRGKGEVSEFSRELSAP